MNERYPGYDVLAKRHTQSWNRVTREIVDARLAVAREPRFFSPAQWRTLERLCARILPQPPDRAPVPLAAYIDEKMLKHGDAATRIEPMPWDGAAWKRALDMLEIEARDAYGVAFERLGDVEADALLARMQQGALTHPGWGEVSPKIFFAQRVVQQISEVYYAHPTAWSEIGFGGPASPRGYVRMDTNRRDPWEAVEATADNFDQALRKNRHVG